MSRSSDLTYLYPWGAGGRLPIHSPEKDKGIRRLPRTVSRYKPVLQISRLIGRDYGTRNRLFPLAGVRR